MTDVIEVKIIEAIDTALKGISWANVVNAWRVRTSFSEMRAHEIPYMQILMLGQDYQPDRTEVRTDWTIAVDLVLRQGTDGFVDQRELLNKRNDILEAIGKDPKLGINEQFIHIIPFNSTDDIHTFEPYYLTTLTFRALFRKRYVRDC